MRSRLVLRKQLRSYCRYGNITTLIAAGVLYLMGTGPIKGFATTLALGIVLSMFTAMVITRVLLYGLYAMGLRDERILRPSERSKNT